MVTYSQIVLTLHLFALPVLPLALSNAGNPDCAWKICRTVITASLNSPHHTGVVRLDLNFDKCSPRNSFPEKCFLPEVTKDVERIINFTMEKAGLTRVPITDFCSFPNLAGVNLRSNNIDSFKYFQVQPKTTCLDKLNYVDLRNNHFTEINLSEFLSIESLEHLDISENYKLETLHITRVIENSKLRILSAAKCNIKTLDISIIRLTSLQDIDLSYNQVSNISNNLGWMLSSSNIKRIEDERNRRKNADANYYLRLSITMLQNHFGDEAFGTHRLWGLPMPRIQVPEDSVDKIAGRLVEFRNAFYSFVYIDNTGSTINCDCKLLHVWEYITQMYKNEEEFEKRNGISLKYWLKLPCMQVGHENLYLKGKTLRNLQASDLLCKHVTNCPRGCTCTEYVLPSKLIVDCKRSGIRTMPEKLPSSVHNVRYEMLMSGNLISELGEIDHPELIDVLDLSDNRLTADTDFSKLRDVLGAQINLSSNPLRELPDSLLNLTSRGRAPNFYFQSHDFVCTCGLFSGDKWIDIKSLFVNYDTIKCVTKTGEQMASLTEFKAVYCPVVQYNSTKIIYREMHIVNKHIVLGVGIAAGTLVIVLLVITAAVVFTYMQRRGHRRHDKYSHRDTSSRICSSADSSMGNSYGYHLTYRPHTYGPIQQYSHITTDRCGIPPDLVPLSASPYDEPRYVSSSEIKDDESLIQRDKCTARRSRSHRELTNPYGCAMRSASFTPILVRGQSCTTSHSHMDLHRSARNVMTLPMERLSTHSSSSEFSSDLSVNSYRGSGGSNLVTAGTFPSTRARGKWVPQHPRTEELRVSLPPPLPPRTPSSATQALLPGMKYSSPLKQREEGKETDV